MRFIGTITQKKPSIVPFVTRLRLVDTMVYSHVKGASVSSTEPFVISCLTLVSLLEIVVSTAKTERSVNIVDSRSVFKWE